MMLLFCTTPVDHPVTSNKSFMETIGQSWQWGKGKLHEIATKSISKTDIIAGAALCTMYYGWSQYQEQQPELGNPVADYVAHGATLFGMAVSKNFYASTVALAALLMPKVTACQPEVVGTLNLHRKTLAGHMVVSNNTALITDLLSFSFIDIKNPQNMSMLGLGTYSRGAQIPNDAGFYWPIASFQARNITAFVHVSRSHIRFINHIPSPHKSFVSGRALSKDWAYFLGRYDNCKGLCILDIRNISNPQLVGVYNLFNGDNDFTTRIKVIKNIAYVPISNTFNLINVTDRTAPKLVNRYTIQGEYVYEFDIQNNTLYVIDSEQLFILNVSNPKKIELINRYVPTISDLNFLTVSGDKVFVADKYSNHVIVLDVQDPQNIKQVGNYTNSLPDPDHTGGLAVIDKTLFVLQEKALQALDISSCL